MPVRKDLEVSMVETRAGHDGPSLADVMCQVIEILQEERGYESIRDMALKLGVPISTFQRAVKPGDRGCTLQALSEICAGLQLTPIEFFEVHPLYKSGRRPALIQRDRRLFQRLRDTLTTQELEEVSTNACFFKQRSLLRSFLNLANAVRRTLLEGSS